MLTFAFMHYPYLVCILFGMPSLHLFTFLMFFKSCTNSTEGSIHGSIWKNQQSPTVFLHDAKNHRYWIAARHYARYRSNTNNKLTFFQKVLVFSDGKKSLTPYPIVLFVVLLLRLDTNSSHAHDRQYRVQRSLAVEVLNR